MSVRVLRVMEYTYPSWEDAVNDQARWKVQGRHSFRQGCVIESRVFSPVEVDDMVTEETGDTGLGGSNEETGATVTPGYRTCFEPRCRFYHKTVREPHVHERLSVRQRTPGIYTDPYR